MDVARQLLTRAPVMWGEQACLMGGGFCHHGASFVTLLQMFCAFRWGDPSGRVLKELPAAKFFSGQSSV